MKEKLKKHLKETAKQTFCWQNLLAVTVTVAVNGTLVFAQSAMPGIDKACAFSDWVEAFAGALCIGGIAWAGFGSLVSHGAGEGITGIVHRLPGAVICLAAGGVVAALGPRFC